jgi:hypothetical protein
MTDRPPTPANDVGDVLEAAALLLVAADDAGVAALGLAFLTALRAPDGDPAAALGLVGDWRERRRLAARDAEIRGWRAFAKGDSDSATSHELAAALVLCAAHPAGTPPGWCWTGEALRAARAVLALNRGAPLGDRMLRIVLAGRRNSGNVPRPRVA